MHFVCLNNLLIKHDFKLNFNSCSCTMHMSAFGMTCCMCAEMLAQLNYRIIVRSCSSCFSFCLSASQIISLSFFKISNLITRYFDEIRNFFLQTFDEISDLLLLLGMHGIVVLAEYWIFGQIPNIRLLNFQEIINNFTKRSQNRTANFIKQLQKHKFHWKILESAKALTSLCKIHF